MRSMRLSVSFLLALPGCHGASSERRGENLSRGHGVNLVFPFGANRFRPPEADSQSKASGKCKPSAGVYDGARVPTSLGNRGTANRMTEP